MSRFVRASRAELPALTALWHTCFGDDPREIAAFWDALFDRITVFAAMEGQQALSMLCALPAELVGEDGESLPAAYLYAVCTAPKARGRGLCTNLLRGAEEALRQDGFGCLALVPESGALFRFYEARGYRAAFFHKTYSVPAGGTAKLAPLDAAGYRALRECFLRGAFLSYDVPFLECQRRASVRAGSGLYRVETETAVCCAAAEKHGDRLFCKELLPDCPDAAAALAAALGCTAAEVHTEGGGEPFGMGKPLQAHALPERAYLGLALD